MCAVSMEVSATRVSAGWRRAGAVARGGAGVATPWFALPYGGPRCGGPLYGSTLFSGARSGCALCGGTLCGCTLDGRTLDGGVATPWLALRSVHPNDMCETGMPAPARRPLQLLGDRRRL
jgi:hypothetical protein